MQEINPVEPPNTALNSSEWLQEIIDELRNVESFRTDEITNKWKVAESLDSVLNSLVAVIVDDQPFGNKRAKQLCTALFTYYDLYILFLKRLVPSIADLQTNTQKWNVHRCLRYFPLPNGKFSEAFFNVEGNNVICGRKNVKLKRWYQDAWLALLRHELPKPLLRKLVPYLGDTVLSVLRDPSLTGDFLFRVFKLGDIYAVISLSAIFKLIMEHNFEYPNFFECVYEMTTPSVCYLSYQQQFFSLLDTFLSSTHLASYVVAAFIKRLCRVLLFAPLCSQQPILGLIRNLLTRHEGVRMLLHRDHPTSFKDDPYRVEEKQLKECGALDSSLWEIKTLQRHWFGEVSRRARFIDKGVQRIESFVRWKSDSEYFLTIMNTRFGKELAEHVQEEQFKRTQSMDSDQDDSDDAEKTTDNMNEPKRKRFRKSSQKKVDKEFELAINSSEPNAQFFCNSLLLDFKDYLIF